jgi:hypothetical protein
VSLSTLLLLAPPPLPGSEPSGAERARFADGALSSIFRGICCYCWKAAAARVAAARAEGSEALSFATDRLRSAHLERIAIEIGFAVALAWNRKPILKAARST